MRLTYVDGNRSWFPWTRTWFPQIGQRSGALTSATELPKVRRNAHFSQTA